MDVNEKIAKALRRRLPDAYIRLEDDDGISGFVVSERLKGMSSLDRQTLIDEALSDAADFLRPEERRRVLMIAGLTPVEFWSIGAHIQVHEVKQTAPGAVEVRLQGGLADAEHVRRVLNNQNGVRTADPKHTSHKLGTLWCVRAKGPATDPLTKEKAIHLLKGDPYIEVLADA